MVVGQSEAAPGCLAPGHRSDVFYGLGPSCQCPSAQRANDATAGEVVLKVPL